MLRVASALFYKRYKEADKLAATRAWEHVYEYGAWGFAALLGLLCWMTLSRTADASLQMAVTTITAGYAAAISGRNAGRPFIAVGQLTLCTLPMCVALLVYPDWVHKALGFVILMFIYGMIDITLSIRDIIIQALTMTRKEAALATRFEQQANRFDSALNNMKILLDHPETKARVAAIRKLAGNQAPSAFLDASEWVDLKQICAGRP